MPISFEGVESQEEVKENASEALIEFYRRERRAEKEKYYELMHQNRFQEAVILAQQSIIKSQELELNTDQKTGVASERGLEQFAERRRGDIEAGSLVVVFFDINKFKSINDTYGHEAGDEALRAVGAYLKKRFRDYDQIAQMEDNEKGDPENEVGRPHGDEFIVVCTNVTAEEIMNRIREEEVALEIEYEGQKIEISLSAGATTYLPGETFKEAKQRADAAMYVMKKARGDGGRE